MRISFCLSWGNDNFPWGIYQLTMADGRTVYTNSTHDRGQRTSKFDRNNETDEILEVERQQIKICFSYVYIGLLNIPL